MVDRRLIPLVAALALAGCSLAPKFEQPKVDTPNAFKQEALALPAGNSSARGSRDSSKLFTYSQSAGVCWRLPSALR